MVAPIEFGIIAPNTNFTKIYSIMENGDVHVYRVGDIQDTSTWEYVSTLIEEPDESI